MYKHGLSLRSKATWDSCQAFRYKLYSRPDYRFCSVERCDGGFHTNVRTGDLYSDAAIVAATAVAKLEGVIVRHISQVERMIGKFENGII
jgi:hypothetical protein